MTKTVVVTGFGPFGTFSRNPSSDVVDKIEELGIEGLNVITQKISVIYEDVSTAVPNLWDQHKPDLIVHIGAHPVDRCVKLEKKAFSEGYCRFDVQGRVPLNNSTCCPAAPTVLESTIDCAKIAADVSKALQLEHVIVQMSEDPGRYLCGFAYFLSLNKDVGKSLFIHVPVFDDVCTLECVTEIVRETIKRIAAEENR